MDVYSIISGGNLDLIRERIGAATPEELNAATKRKRKTPLHLAVIKNRADIVRLLLDAGAAIDPEDNLCNTPLLVAVDKGYKDCIELLARRGADVNIAVNKGYKPSHIAALHGHVDCLRALLDAGADPKLEDWRGCTPLHIAADNGQTDCVAALLSEGAQPDAVSKGGTTALHLAARSGSVDCLALLLNAGAKTEIMDRDGNTALNLVSIIGHSGCLKLLIESGAKVIPSAKHEAAGGGYLDSFYLLMAVDKDAHVSDKKGRTVLHLLAQAEYLSGDVSGLMPALCDARTGLDRLDKNGNSALHYAVISGDKAELAKAFVALGADINVRDGRGNTPLHRVCNDNMASVLMQNQAEVHVVNDDGETPLHAAAGRGSAGIIRTLIDGGADANAHDRNGNTPLHLAVSQSHLDCINVLLPVTNEANIDGYNSRGLTPILIAAEDINNDSVKLLLAAGADPNKPSRPCMAHEPPESEYPIGIALSNYYENMAVTLLQGGARAECGYGALNSMYQDFGADTRDPEERTLLPERRRLLYILLQYGLDPAQAVPACEYGDTLLHTLCQNGAPIDDIKLVLECDHTLANMKNTDGDTPLQCYIKGAITLRIGAVSALLEAGADVTINDGQGKPLLSLLDGRLRWHVPEGLRDMLVENGAHSDEMRLPEDKPGRGDLLACSP